MSKSNPCIYKIELHAINIPVSNMKVLSCSNKLFAHGYIMVFTCSQNNLKNINTRYMIGHINTIRVINSTLILSNCCILLHTIYTCCLSRNNCTVYKIYFQKNRMTAKICTVHVIHVEQYMSD